MENGPIWEEKCSLVLAVQRFLSPSHNARVSYESTTAVRLRFFNHPGPLTGVTHVAIYLDSRFD